MEDEKHNQKKYRYINKEGDKEETGEEVVEEGVDMEETG